MLFRSLGIAFSVLSGARFEGKVVVVRPLVLKTSVIWLHLVERLPDEMIVDDDFKFRHEF